MATGISFSDVTSVCELNLVERVAQLAQNQYKNISVSIRYFHHLEPQQRSSPTSVNAMFSHNKIQAYPFDALLQSIYCNYECRNECMCKQS